MYAEDAHVTHPFQPVDRPLIGRARLAGHFAAGAAVPRTMDARDVVIHETGDPEVVIAESRDHADHLAMAHAADRVPNLVAALDPARR